jgi:carboxypeptidase C (cathepsin A)
MRLLLMCFALVCLGIGCGDTAAVFKCPQSKAPQLPVFGQAQQTGYLESKLGNLFYWLVKAKKNPDTAPVVLWLNGGPGSSSLIGLFLENGPLNVTPSLTLVPNPFPWNENANMIYLEQPAGVGFSNLKDASRPIANISEVAVDIVAALDDFFGVKHPEFKGRDFYVFGESFAGTYIPWIGEAILNRKPSLYALKGVAIFDGTVDTLANWSTMADYASEVKIISDAQRDQIKRDQLPLCVAQLQDLRATQDVTTIADKCEALQTQVAEAANNVNIYDIRDQYPEPLEVVSCYLNLPQVKASLNVAEPEKPWSNTSEDVFNRLGASSNVPAVDKIASLLNQGLKVLIVNADKDLIIQYIGTEKWLDTLPQMNGVNFVDWSLYGTQYGLLKFSGNLTYVRVFNAGHLLPTKQALEAKMLLDQFTSSGIRSVP